MKNIISKKSIFILLTSLIVFSCTENNLTPESANPQEEPFAAPIGNVSIHTVYIEWHDYVSKVKRKSIRDSYRDPMGEIVIISDELCNNDRDIETWVISFDSGNYQNCCKPDPKVIIKDNEGEMSKVSYLDLCNDSL